MRNQWDKVVSRENLHFFHYFETKPKKICFEFGGNEENYEKNMFQSKFS